MVNTIMRTQAAIASLPFLDEAGEGLLTEWLNQMLFPQNPIEREPSVTLSTDLKTSQATTWVGNANGLLAKQLQDFMEASDFKAVERKLLKHMLDEVPEGQLHAWLRLGEDGARATGWIIDGVFPLKEAMALVSKGTVKDHLEKWYAQFEADAAVRIGREVASERYTILHTELFGDNVQEDLELYLNLNHTLELSPITDVLLELILEEDPEYLEVAYWLGNGGVVQLGLVVPDPSPRLMQRLALAYDEGAVDTLAAFEGTLGSSGANKMLLARRASGIVVELYYE